MASINTKSVFRFEDARAYVRKLIKGSADYYDWSKSNLKVADIPSAPDNIYKDAGWINWPDWLGNDPKSNKRTYRDFENARRFVQSLGLRTQNGFHQWSKQENRPLDIPSNPAKSIKMPDGLIGLIGLEMIQKNRIKELIEILKMLEDLFNPWA